MEVEVEKGNIHSAPERHSGRERRGTQRAQVGGPQGSVGTWKKTQKGDLRFEGKKTLII